MPALRVQRALFGRARRGLVLLAAGLAAQLGPGHSLTCTCNADVCTKDTLVSGDTPCVVDGAGVLDHSFHVRGARPPADLVSCPTPRVRHQTSARPTEGVCQCDWRLRAEDMGANMQDM